MLYRTEQWLYCCGCQLLSVIVIPSSLERKKKFVFLKLFPIQGLLPFLVLGVFLPGAFYLTQGVSFTFFSKVKDTSPVTTYSPLWPLLQPVQERALLLIISASGLGRTCMNSSSPVASSPKKMVQFCSVGDAEVIFLSSSSQIFSTYYDNLWRHSTLSDTVCFPKLFCTKLPLQWLTTTKPDFSNRVQ